MSMLGFFVDNLKDFFSAERVRSLSGQLDELGMAALRCRRRHDVIVVSWTA